MAALAALQRATISSNGMTCESARRGDCDMFQILPPPLSTFLVQLQQPTFQAAARCASFVAATQPNSAKPPHTDAGNGTPGPPDSAVSRANGLFRLVFSGTTKVLPPCRFTNWYN